MATLIDGKAIAKTVRDEVASGVRAFKDRYGRAPGLQVVLVGDDPASAVYVRHKETAALEVGMAGGVTRLPADTTEAFVVGLVRELNDDAATDGILVQFPVPAQISQSKVILGIDSAKDVDGLHPVNAGALWAGQPGLVSCTPRGVLRLLKECKIPLSGARAVVVGRSALVGKPVAGLLLNEHATVSIAHSKTRDLPGVCREADVLVAAVGKARMIQGGWLKAGVAVIDVGTNRMDNGKLCGDVDFASAEPVASFISPVPGGVGPMTIAMLLENTLLAARARAGE